MLIAALIRTRAKLLDLSGFFYKIYEDVDALISKKGLVGPIVPDDFKY
jgi:hypothetical protein